MARSHRLSRPRGFFVSTLLVCIPFALVLASCNANFTTTSLGSAPGTIVDLHGNSGISALPASCQTSTPAFPPLPADWWAGVTPQVRTASAVVGYETWIATGLPAMCPVERRTDVYRAFYKTDISSLAGKSGSIAKATVVLTGRFVPGITPATIAASNGAMPNSNLCDAVSGGAFQLRQVAQAFPMPTGFTTNFLSNGTFNVNSPPIPNSYPNGPVLLTFPNKNPSQPGSLGQQRFEADITHIMVSALEAGVTNLNFMITGTNEPPLLQEAPSVPQTDCKAAFSLDVQVQTP